MQECAKRKESVIAQSIQHLPAAQQVLVKECYAASNKKGKEGRRYSADWIYECILMRIKSPALYEHLRVKDILLISMKTRGGLKHPSDEMFKLCSILEDAVTNVLSSKGVTTNVLFAILDLLETVSIPKVGCKEHKHSLTSAIVNFYLIIRMYFACKRYTEINNAKKEKTKLFRKQAKLV